MVLFIASKTEVSYREKTVLTGLNLEIPMN